MQQLAGRAPPVLTQSPETKRSGDQRFRRQHRLLKHDVVALLRHGARLSREPLALRLLENVFGQGRIAIAVPKRIVKSAVARNAVKRAIREEFRQHGARALPVDLLVTLQDQIPAQKRSRKDARRNLRGALTQMLRVAMQRFGVDGALRVPEQ